MAAIRTARDRARAELTQEIKDEARRQLAEVGAQGLSLRAVARELGMVSSALYRYFPSRDSLLTALIVDAYNAIGEAAEKADDPAERPRTRWRLIWQATRAWARQHPHEYTLIYGSPIPGYQAPQDTVAPAARVALALAEVAVTAPLEPAFPGPALPDELADQARRLAELLGKDIAPADVSRLLIAWTQLFGALNFELFGQYVGSADPADALFAHTTDQMADFLGLR
ncbi:AcrR family transcriptional regulator [Amycolatopsis bartoniae]|nr:TetR/AcrR family transcriptional regulator [Amycolatopsis bartoniae]MBB2933580.1 AcrR family transcriptional regulator [Amycolatopsis bartoniae]TVT10759.1 TetR/AcrR family transcriptional regulator [Amycolatopsis bartoniae]